MPENNLKYFFTVSHNGFIFKSRSRSCEAHNLPRLRARNLINGASIMVTLRIKVLSYDKNVNLCKAELLNGDKVDFDPFALSAIDLSDEDYEAGLGAEVVGKEYILTEYSVYKDSIVPHENGMIEL